MSNLWPHNSTNVCDCGNPKAYSAKHCGCGATRPTEPEQKIDPVYGKLTKGDDGHWHQDGCELNLDPRAEFSCPCSCDWQPPEDHSALLGEVQHQLYAVMCLLRPLTDDLENRDARGRTNARHASKRIDALLTKLNNAAGETNA